MPNHRIHAHSMDWASMDPEGIYGGRIFAEMTEIPPSAKAPAPSAAAQRVRRHRERVFLFAKYAQRITACQRKSVDSIIECGQLLIAAKDELKHGEFLKMIDNNLPFKRSSAQAFMRIANDKRITNNQRAGCLPPHWSTLAKLTQLPDAAFEARIADGTIHPGLERGPAAEMIDSYFSSMPKREEPLNVSIIKP